MDAYDIDDFDDVPADILPETEDDFGSVGPGLSINQMRSFKDGNSYANHSQGLSELPESLDVEMPESQNASRVPDEAVQTQNPAQDALNKESTQIYYDQFPPDDIYVHPIDWHMRVPDYAERFREQKLNQLRIAEAADRLAKRIEEYRVLHQAEAHREIYGEGHLQFETSALRMRLKDASKAEIMKEPPVDGTPWMGVTAVNRDGNRSRLYLRNLPRWLTRFTSKEQNSDVRKQLFNVTAVEKLRTDVLRLRTTRREEEQTAERLASSDSVASQQPLEETSAESSLWVDKYKPTAYVDLLSDEGTNRLALSWLRLWDECVFGQKAPSVHRFRQKEQEMLEVEATAPHRPVHKILLLAGNAGVGKTTLATILVKHSGYGFVHVNASDSRNTSDLERLLHSVSGTKRTVAGTERPQVLLLDEIDGAPGEAINWLCKAISATGKKALKRPVIAICNTLYSPNLRELRQHALVLTVNKTNERLLFTRLERIAETEKLRIENAALEKLVECTEGDVRLSVNTLQFLGQTTRRDQEIITEEDVTKACTRFSNGNASLFDCWSSLLDSTRHHDRRGALTADAARVSTIEHTWMLSRDQKDRFVVGLHNNYTRHHPPLPLNKLRPASDCFVFYDLLNTSILKKQDWSLAKYFYDFYVPLHFLLTTHSKLQLAYPQTDANCVAKLRTNTDCVSSIRPQSTLTHSAQLVTEVLPYLLEIAQPAIPKGAAAVLAVRNNKLLLRIATVMDSFGLNFKPCRVQGRVQETQWLYSPPIDVLCLFGIPGSSHKFVVNSLREEIARMIEARTWRLADEDFDKENTPANGAPKEDTRKRKWAVALGNNVPLASKKPSASTGIQFVHKPCPYNPSHSATNEDLASLPSTASNIRNIGIIAHIDAGKTTVTEKFLYLTGMTSSAGNVDSGTTVTDFLDMERERGITIQSAAVHFEWLGNRINLVDTPGHVDFTIEVERSMRVMDGVVVILDGAVGVQAQTLTVWRQAGKFGLPAVFFLNKLDKKTANFQKAYDSIQQKLGLKAILTTGIVTDQSGKIDKIVDLLTGKSLDLLQTNAKWEKIKGNDNRLLDIYNQQREEMLYAVADCDKPFASYFLDKIEGKASKITQEELLKTLRRVTLERTGSVLSCGTALRCSASVIPLLDSVVSFLPSPEEKDSYSKLFGDKLSALVFKIQNDKKKGQLNYVRVYTGALRNNSHVFNSTRGEQEGPIKLFIPYSDDLTPTAEVTTGNIAVVSGLHQTRSGDTLLGSEAIGWDAASKYSADVGKEARKTSPASVIRQAKSEKDSIILSGIESPDPVYYCSIEPPTSAAQHEFSRALRELCVEDPSIRVRESKETGQTILEAMGELHLEVIKDRLLRGYGLSVFLGPLQVAYREMLRDEIVHTATVEESFDGRMHSASLTMRVNPESDAQKFKQVTLKLPADAGCHNALHSGPILGFPISNVSISLEGIVVSGGRIKVPILSACAHRCVSEALVKAGARLAEPVMRIEVMIQGASSDYSTQPLQQELVNRRGQITEIVTDGQRFVTIHCLLPLAEMTGLATTIRTLSSGLASLHAEVAEYQLLTEYEQSQVAAKIRGCP
ncbi:unnamed protein product, partial [Mesorhabditis spiculigera]